MTITCDSDCVTVTSENLLTALLIMGIKADFSDIEDKANWVIDASGQCFKPSQELLK